MSVVRKILYASGAVLLLLVVVGVFLPSAAHVERKITIDSHPAIVFALLNDFHRITEWSPWIEADSAARVELSGPDMGVDAAVRWDGGVLGQGSETIVESVPFERVVGRLDLDGMPALSTFTLDRADGGTGVLWEFDVDFGIDLVGRYLGLFLDHSVGRDYERGLVNLKTLAESLPQADFSDAEIEPMLVEPIDIAYQRMTSQPTPTAISEAMGKAYFNILSYMDRHGLQDAGAPLSISRRFSGAELVFDAAIPVSGVTDETPDAGDGVKLGQTYGGPVIRARHLGSYRNLGQTHEKMAAYLAAHGIERNGDAWESYVSDPTRVPESELVTYVYYPVKARSR